MRSGQQRGKVAVRSQPQDLLWQRDLDRFFKRGFGLGPWFPWVPTRKWRRPWMPDEWMPDMDLFEREGKFVVRTDIPGMKREDLEVKVEGETLVVHGHREEKDEVKEKDYHHCERRAGEFTRTVALPDGFDPDAIEATYQDGVLEVTVPKPAADARPVRIQVK
jgi:HSP20 family protein